jgi:O-antigen ligase
MLLNIKALIFLLFISFIAFHYARKVTKNLISDAQFKQWKVSWLLLTSFAFLSFNYWLYAALVLIFTSYKTKREKYPIAFYIAILFTAPPITATIAVAGVYLFEINYLMLLSIGVLLKLHLTRRSNNPKFSFGKTKTDIIIATFILVNIGIAFKDSTFTDTLRQSVVMILSTFLPYYVVSRHVKNIEDLNAIFSALMIAAFPIALVSIFESLKHWLLYSSIAGSLGLQWNYGGYLMRGAALRASASTGHSLALGFSLVVFLGFYLHVKNHVDNKKYRLIGMFFILLGLLASLARGSWIAMFVLITTYLYLGKNAASNLIKFLMVCILAFSIIAVLPSGDKFINLLPFVGNVDAGNVDYRQKLFKASVSVVSRSPMFGNKNYAEEPEMQSMYQGQHIIDLVNVYLAILLQSGYIGLLLFASIFLSSLLAAYKASKKIRQSNPELHQIGRSLVATLAAMMFNLATLSFELSIPFLCYICVGLCVAYSQIAKKELSLASSPRPLKASSN